MQERENGQHQTQDTPLTANEAFRLAVAMHKRPGWRVIHIGGQPDAAFVMGNYPAAEALSFIYAFSSWGQWERHYPAIEAGTEGVSHE